MPKDRIASAENVITIAGNVKRDSAQIIVVIILAVLIAARVLSDRKATKPRSSAPGMRAQKHYAK